MCGVGYGKVFITDCVGDLITDDDSISFLRDTPSENYGGELGLTSEISYNARNYYNQGGYLSTKLKSVSITIFIGHNRNVAGIRSCAIDVDPSYSEGVVCVRNKSTSGEGSVHHIHLTRDHSCIVLFLEYYYIVGNHSITFDALYFIPGHIA